MKKLAISLLGVLAACSGGQSEQQSAIAAETAQPDAASAPVAATDFEMPVMDAFAITGRDDVVTGKVTSGSVSVGDTICLVSRENGSKEYVVGGIEKLRKLMETVSAGDMAGIELKGFDHKELQKGDKVTLRGSC